MNFFLKVIKIFPPEAAHSISLNSLNFLHKINLLNIFFKKISNDEIITFANIKFKNRLGTAAGLDKNGDFIDCLGSLGFGFLEVGTVTPVSQKGNNKPRVHRNFKENSIINSLGFNNKGVDYLVKNLKNKDYPEVRKWCVNNLDNDPSVLMRRIYDSLYESLIPATIPAAVLILAKYQYQIAFVADQEINLLACLTEIMVECKFK